jgi:hypothetical protein
MGTEHVEFEMIRAFSWLKATQQPFHDGTKFFMRFTPYRFPNVPSMMFSRHNNHFGIVVMFQECFTIFVLQQFSFLNGPIVTITFAHFSTAMSFL